MNGSTLRVGSTVPAPPSEVRLSFSEGVEPHFSGIEVTSADGRSVAAGRVQAQGSEMRVALVRGLPAGFSELHGALYGIPAKQEAASRTQHSRTLQRDDAPRACRKCESTAAHNSG
ncbi:copper resistance CopC family protein [Methylobacterium sp. P31]